MWIGKATSDTSTSFKKTLNFFACVNGKYEFKNVPNAEIFKIVKITQNLPQIRRLRKGSAFQQFVIQ